MNVKQTPIKQNYWGYKFWINLCRNYIFSYVIQGFDVDRKAKNGAIVFGKRVWIQFDINTQLVPDFVQLVTHVEFVYTIFFIILINCLISISYRITY